MLYDGCAKLITILGYANELGEECIICCHKPLDKTLCEPNKPMRITIKALLKRKFNDRVKKQAEAAKIQQVKIIKEIPITPSTSVELEKQVSPIEDKKTIVTTDTQDVIEPLVSFNGWRASFPY